MKYLNIIPLVGGMTVANIQATKKKPEIIFSFEPFKNNDSHVLFNYPNIPYVLLDTENPKESDLSKFETKLKNIDFVSSVCPCAGLSMYSAGKKSAKAKQNEWMFKTADFILDRVKPKVFFGENAPGLFTQLGEKVGETLFEIGQQYGYSFTIYRTNTIFHGIPQNRPRTFYFFWNSRTAPIMSWYKRDKKTLSEYLKEIPENTLYHTEEDKKQCKEIAESDYTWMWLKSNFENPREELRKSNCASVWDFAVQTDRIDEMAKWLEENGYEKGAKRAKAISEKVKNGGNYWDNSIYVFKDHFNALIGRSMDSLNPTEDRTITLREAMHLMGLPHDYKLIDPYKNRNHITQNVPVSTAKDMTTEVIKYIKGELNFSDAFFLKQDNISEKKIVEVKTEEFSLNNFL